MCDGFRCVECGKDHHCSAGHYCKFKNVPIILNQCTKLLPNGDFCLFDHVSACSTLSITAFSAFNSLMENNPILMPFYFKLLALNTIKYQYSCNQLQR